jgi:hypothetical protein
MPILKIAQRRLFLGIILILISPFIALAIASFAWTRPDPFWEKYEQVQVGMSHAQVTAILGPPEEEIGMSFQSAAIWSEVERSIVVSFGGGDKVYEKRFVPQPPWELRWLKIKK